MVPDARTFAEEWIAVWNSHDLDAILSHYADDIQLTSPMIKVALGVDSGTLHGKDAVRQYWGAALEKVPDLCFRLVEVMQSVDSIALYYESVMGKMAVEVLWFDDSGRARKAIAHYN